MKRILKWFKSLFPPPCKHCGSFQVERGEYIRGWNNWCEQAYGDRGSYCYNCRKVTFDKSLEEHKSTLPDWCTPYR